MPCQQLPRAGRAVSHRGAAVPAASVGRQCRQAPRAGRACKSCEPAMPAAAAGRPGRQPPRAGPAAVARRALASPLAASCGRRIMPGCWVRGPGRGARRERLLRPANPARKEVGVAWGEGMGRVSWDYTFSDIRGTCSRGPFAACTGRRALTGRYALQQRRLRRSLCRRARARGAARVRAEAPEGRAEGRAYARARARGRARVRAEGPRRAEGRAWDGVSAVRACCACARSGARRG
jgi:hypothetical protein